jgi:CRISPR-associated protein Cas2
MRRHDFVVSYDIADPKRLRKVAKLLESEAMRFQYSLYLLYDVDGKELSELLGKILEVLDETEDDLRVYRIDGYGLAMGTAVELDDPLRIV